MTDPIDERVREPWVHSSHFDTDSWVKSEWKDHALACEAEIGSLARRVLALEEDIKVAAGAFTVPCPEPGTHMARLLIANRLLRAEVTDTRARLATVTAQRERAAAADACMLRDLKRNFPWIAVLLGVHG